MDANTKTLDMVTVERDARIMRESLSRCRRDVSVPLRDEYVRNLIKRVENDRTKDCEHIVTLLRDAFTRGGNRADLEAFPRAMLAMIASWYGDDLGDLPTLLRLETQAQAVADLSEMDLALDGTPKAIADASDALRGHLVAIERLVAACERRQFAPSLPSIPRQVA